ncbi:PaO domain-containing protein [Haematococcus lacustris]|uniref:PaO domain-containing protein n=1 Tax=Haematococcus lacustris TaxID=44745 RepID=A0A699YVQ9_HAELA|nr:PaO domain-containing protein [Haematococcus lacustris]
MQHKLDASEKRGFQSLTVVYAVPQAPGRCRLINRNVVRFTRTSLPARLLRLLPRWVSHVGSHVPLEDDQAAHAADMAAACAVAAAVLTAALAAAASVYSPVQTLSAPAGGVSGDVIAAVANMTAGAVLTLVNVVVGTGGPNAQAMRSLAWVVMAAGAAFIAHAARRLQARFHHGDYPPPRNMEAT